MLLLETFASFFSDGAMVTLRTTEFLCKLTQLWIKWSISPLQAANG